MLKIKKLIWGIKKSLITRRISFKIKKWRKFAKIKTWLSTKEKMTSNGMQKPTLRQKTVSEDDDYFQRLLTLLIKKIMNISFKFMSIVNLSIQYYHWLKIDLLWFLISLINTFLIDNFMMSIWKAYLSVCILIVISQSFVLDQA